MVKGADRVMLSDDHNCLFQKKYIMMNTDRIDAESSVVSFNEMAGNCGYESKKEKILQTCPFFLFFLHGNHANMGLNSMWCLQEFKD